MKVRLPQNRKNVLQQPLCSEEDEEVTFMLDESAVGLSVEQDFSYTWRDLILYNLSVGAKQEELEYVYEKGLKAVPTFGVIPRLNSGRFSAYLPEIPLSRKMKSSSIR